MEQYEIKPGRTHSINWTWLGLAGIVAATIVGLTMTVSGCLKECHRHLEKPACSCQK